MANRTKLTERRRAQFVEILGQTCNVTLACRQVGVARITAYERRQKDEDFAEAWDNAVEEAVDLLEAEARRRAYHGTQKPVFHKGKQCGAIQEYSDGLLMFLLKSHRPHKYRDRYEFTGADGGPIEVREIRRVIVDP